MVKLSSDNLKYFLCVFVFIVHSTQGQFIEFGAGLGVTQYSGDLSSGYRFSTAGPAVTGHLRLNFSEIVSNKIGIIVGGIQANDEAPVDVLGQNRRHSFQSTVVEIGSVFEYHFLDYKNHKSPQKWSPYVFIGFGILRLEKSTTEDFNKNQPVIPMGVGFKHKIGKQFVVEIEAGARKTWSDLIDGISDEDTTIKNYQYGNPNDYDWYYFTGIRVSYVLYKIPCPFPYIPNRYLYKR